MQKIIIMLLLTSCQVKCTSSPTPDEPEINYCINEDYMKICEQHSNHSQWGFKAQSYYSCCYDNNTFEYTKNNK